jgi:hypothetical protein
MRKLWVGREVKGPVILEGVRKGHVPPIIIGCFLVDPAYPAGNPDIAPQFVGWGEHGRPLLRGRA